MSLPVKPASIKPGTIHNTFHHTAKADRWIEAYARCFTTEEQSRDALLRWVSPLQPLPPTHTAYRDQPRMHGDQRTHFVQIDRLARAVAGAVDGAGSSRHRLRQFQARRGAKQRAPRHR